MNMSPFKIDAKILAVAPWAGGKRRLAPRIVELLGEHGTYVEPFVGGCAILSQKAPCKREQVNDANPAVVNVLRAMRHNEYQLSRMLGPMAFDRQTFDNAKHLLASIAPGADLIGTDIAAAQLVVWWMGANGYAGTSKTGWFAQRYTKTGGDPAVRWESFKRSLPALSERLRYVEIHNRDYRDFITEEKDRPGTVVYADPPYFSKKFKYAHDFTAQDHVDLADLLNRFERARVVVSYYDAPELATLYPPERWERHEVAVSKPSANARTGATKTTATELLLVNRRAA